MPQGLTNPQVFPLGKLDLSSSPKIVIGKKKKTQHVPTCFTLVKSQRTQFPALCDSEQFKVQFRQLVKQILHILRSDPTSYPTAHLQLPEACRGPQAHFHHVLRDGRPQALK